MKAGVGTVAAIFLSGCMTFGSGLRVDPDDLTQARLDCETGQVEVCTRLDGQRIRVRGVLRHRHNDPLPELRLATENSDVLELLLIKPGDKRYVAQTYHERDVVLEGTLSSECALKRLGRDDIPVRITPDARCLAREGVYLRDWRVLTDRPKDDARVELRLRDATDPESGQT